MERFLLDFKKDGLLCLHLLTSHIDVRVDAHFFDDCIPSFSCNGFIIPQLFQLMLELV